MKEKGSFSSVLGLYSFCSYHSFIHSCTGPWFSTVQGAGNDNNLASRCEKWLHMADVLAFQHACLLAHCTCFG